MVGGQTTIHAGLIWCDPPDTTPHRSFPAEGKRKGNARTACKPGILDTAMLDKRLPNGWTMAGALAAVAQE